MNREATLLRGVNSFASRYGIIEQNKREGVRSDEMRMGKVMS